MNNDNRQTATNFNQTYHDVNELNKNNELTKSVNINDRKSNAMSQSVDKAIEMYL